MCPCDPVPMCDAVPRLLAPRYRMYAAARCAPFSMAPMEVVSMNCPSRSQGGGVCVDSGAVVSFSGCDIHDNEAYYVRLCLAPFHGPHGRRFPELTLYPRVTRCPAVPRLAAAVSTLLPVTPHSMAPMEVLSRN